MSATRIGPVFSGGGGSSAPNDATYVVLSSNATLTNERILTGTVNQIVVTDNGAGNTVVLSTPQNIHTAATPIFAGLTLSALTSGSILFAGTGGIISQDNSNFFWDVSNHRLGINSVSPVVSLSNSSSNITDESGNGIANTGLLWSVNGGAYIAGIYAGGLNQSNAGVANASGLLINIRNINSGSKILTLNSNGTDRFVVQGDGKVGVGTNSPSTLLEIGKVGLLGAIGLAGDTSGLVTIQPATSAGTWTLTLPTTAGTNNYFLKTNGSGVTTWAQVDLSTGVTGTLPVANGGTGQTSYTNGQLLIGNTTGNTLTKATLTGTSNQVVVTNSTGSITLSTPQDIATGSSPTFAGLTLSSPLTLANGGTNASLTASNGAIPYSSSTAIALLASTSSAGQHLVSGASAAPAWLTNTTVSFAYVTLGINQTMTANQFNKVNLAAGTDNLGEWSNANHNFTPATSGTYLIDCSATFTDLVSTDRVIFSIFVGGSETDRMFDAAISGKQVAFCQILQLTAGSAYDFRIFCDNARTIGAGTETHMKFIRVV